MITPHMYDDPRVATDVALEWARKRTGHRGEVPMT